MRYFIVLTLTLLFLVGCADDNAYDGKNGLISGGSQSTLATQLQRINDEVLVAQSVLLLEQSTDTYYTLLDLQSTQNSATLASAQNAAKALFMIWKKVEALYVAKKYDDAMIDIPAQIDVFNSGNIDVPTKLESVFASDSALEGQLYQSATRSMGALEYTLFADADMTQRRADAAVIMITYLQAHIQTIADFYAASNAFSESGEDTVGVLINQLIDSTYKLKEWRIGEPAGFTLKYEDDPDATRLEYYYSINSLAGIRAILSAQKAVMEAGLLEIASGNSATSEAEGIAALIDDAIAQVDAYEISLEADVASTQTRDLYETIDALQSAYSALISALNFQQDIIEADGD